MTQTHYFNFTDMSRRDAYYLFTRITQPPASRGSPECAIYQDLVFLAQDVQGLGGGKCQDSGKSEKLGKPSQKKPVCI